MDVASARVVATLVTPYLRYALINSVDFHPSGTLLSATYGQNDGVAIYRLDGAKGPRLAQKLRNPWARLSNPQHAAFTPDGRRLVVVNWEDGTLATYACAPDGRLAMRPLEHLPPPEGVATFRPHGISPSRDGRWLAMAYGASTKDGRALLVRRLGEPGMPVFAMRGAQDLPGVPKGVCFTPDGGHLVASFTHPDTMVVFRLDTERPALEPVQTVEGTALGIARPEDIRLSPDGTLLAVTNNSGHTISLHGFDPRKVRLEVAPPRAVLGAPDVPLTGPHGVAFSPDGGLLAVSEFGPVRLDTKGDVYRTKGTRRRLARVQLVALESPQPAAATVPGSPKAAARGRAKAP
jgi:DNA-binding beta-propeller fold protein YncE